MKEDAFMAYDIRGKELDTHDAFILGRALGSYFTGTCFVSWDCRKLSPLLGQHLIEGLRTSGIKVTIGGFMPGPAGYYKTMNNYDFGVYITASHLPPEYNGFKIIMKDGSSIDPNDLLNVKKIFNTFKFNKADPVPAKQDIMAINDYAGFLEKEFGRMEIKCVIDCLNASTGVLSERVFKRLLDARVINDTPKPDFGGKSPEPTDKNLGELKEAVVKTKSKFGIALDGDGDRGVFVDETGKTVSGNLMTMLFSKKILEKKKGVIVAPVSVSSMLETKVVKPMGGSVAWCQVGHTFIEKELLKKKGLFGGEESSHFYFNEHYPFSDGVISALMLARILKESGKKFSELINELPNLHVSKEEVEFNTHKEKEDVAKQIINHLLTIHPDANTMDGAKFIDGESAILLRPSQTRHTVKVFVEAESEEIMNAKLDEYVKLINSFRQ